MAIYRYSKEDLPNPNDRANQANHISGDTNMPSDIEYAVVMGGQKPPPVTAAVLGGVAGIVQKNRFRVSKLQQDIFEVISREKGVSLQIEATAGSGKTSTLLDAASLVQGQILFVAFNRHIVQEIKEKLQQRGVKHAAVKTVHSIGFGCLAKEIKVKIQDPREYKYLDILDSYIEDRGLENELGSEEKFSIVKLIDFTQTSLIDPSDLNNLEYLIGFHNLTIDSSDVFEIAADAVKAVLEEGERLARFEGIISFTDMIWLPYQWNLTPRKYECVFGDEIQDWSRASLDLVRKCKTYRGRFILVGDPNQSLYGFGGADPQMWQEIKKMVLAHNGKQMPLNESFRCAHVIVREARKYNPNIKAFAENPEGEVRYIEQDEFLSEVSAGSMVIARRTAPLVANCIRLIGLRKKAYVLGRDIGNGLTSVVKQVGKRKDFNWQQFPIQLDGFVKSKIAQLSKKKHSESKIQVWIDKYEGIMACYEGFINGENSTSNFAQSDKAKLSQFVNSIEEIFEDKGAGIQLMTIHKSKGLESDKVYILEPDRLKLEWKDMQYWQAIQETNCAFVAVTRAKNTLIYVRG